MTRRLSASDERWFEHCRAKRREVRRENAVCFVLIVLAFVALFFGALYGGR